MSTAEPAELLRRFHEAWAPFWSRIAAVDATASRTPPFEGGWPLALTLAHCARWEVWTYNAVTVRVTDGTAPSMAGAEHWNEHWAAEDRDITLTNARQRLGASHERLATLLDALRPDHWDDVVRRTVDFCTFHHYSEHISDVPA